MSAARVLLATFLLSLLFATHAAAQSECSLPPGLKSAHQQNLFSDQQEAWLGEIMDKEIRGDYNVIPDPDNYLQKIGDRLQAQLPPSGTHIAS